MKTVPVFLLLFATIARTEPTIRDEVDDYIDCKPSPTTVSGSAAPSGVLCKNQLIFEENFNTFDTNIWHHEQQIFGADKTQFQWYTNSSRNSFVSDGRLHIKPTLTSSTIKDIFYCHVIDPGCVHFYDYVYAIPTRCHHFCSPDYPAPPVQSANIHTKQTFSFRYGRVEIRAKIPTGDFLWPAIKLKSMYELYGAYPLSGEIIVMESRGNVGDIGVGSYHAALLFSGYMPQSVALIDYEHLTEEQPGLNVQFHDYQLEWAPSHIQFSIDGTVVGRVETNDGYTMFVHSRRIHYWDEGELDAPFDQEFYLDISLAVGGVCGYFPDSIRGKSWKNGDKFAVRNFWNGRRKWLKTWMNDMDDDDDDNDGRTIEMSDVDDESDEVGSCESSNEYCSSKELKSSGMEESEESSFDEYRDLSFQIEHIRIYAL